MVFPGMPGDTSSRIVILAGNIGPVPKRAWRGISYQLLGPSHATISGAALGEPRRSRGTCGEGDGSAQG